MVVLCCHNSACKFCGLDNEGKREVCRGIILSAIAFFGEKPGPGPRRSLVWQVYLGPGTFMLGALHGIFASTIYGTVMQVLYSHKKAIFCGVR